MPTVPNNTLNTAGTGQSGQGSSFKVALLILAILYFMLGFITVLNDTLVPFFKQGFNLTYSQSSLVQFYFYLTYGLISIPAGRLVDRIGFKNGMVLGFGIAAIGAFLFYPASLFHEYYLFLAALFIVAIGIVLLQVSANPYITFLGPAETAASRLTLIQGVGSLGTTIAPIFGAHFILSKITETNNSSSILVKPYMIIATGLLLIGILIFSINFPQAKKTEAAESAAQLGIFQLLSKFPVLKFGIIAIFMYVGAEVAIGTYLTNYIADRMDIAESSANVYLTYYWGGMLVGRFVGSFFLNKFQSSKILFIVSLMAASLVLLSLITTGAMSVWLMVLVGLCNSIMFASIFSLSVNGLGRNTGQASGLLSTAIVGGAFLTYGQGYLKDVFNWEIAFALPIIAYLVIVLFSRYASSTKAHSLKGID